MTAPEECQSWSYVLSILTLRAVFGDFKIIIVLQIVIRGELYCPLRTRPISSMSASFLWRTLMRLEVIWSFRRAMVPGEQITANSRMSVSSSSIAGRIISVPTSTACFRARVAKTAPTNSTGRGFLSSGRS